MADTQRQAWPNRRIEILVPTTMLCGLSTIIQVWGLAYGFKIKRKLLLCDTLLVLAALLNITSTSICYETTHYGQGRHINDPSVSKSHDLTQYNYYLWIGQIINLIALTLLKYSICAYLLALKFSQVYLGVVWVSILMLTVLNFLMPIINMFCRDPLEANWNRDIGGKCFMKIGESRLAYTQAISNIITNVIYIVAPIIYLFTFQLPRQTQWGVCFICGLGFIAVACSIVKTIELSTLLISRDTTWDSTNFSIWSAIELSLGVLIASLLPLRKQFDAIFRCVLQSIFKSSNPRIQDGSGIPMYNSSRPFTMGSNPNGKRPLGNCDDDSETHMLDSGGVERKFEITKTVMHTVRSEERDIVKLPGPTYRT